MAQTLCQLKKKGGGKPKGTLLWTNPNPSASFGEGYLTLSDSCFNYDAIKIEYKIQTSSAKAISVISPKEVFTSPDGVVYRIGMPSNNIDGIGIYLRHAYRYPLTDTTGKSVYIESCRVVTSTATNNSYCIPVNIYGLKY